MSEASIHGEQLTSSLSQINSLSAENSRLKARLAQLRNLDPERIVRLAEQVTLALKTSEERSEQLLRVIGELRERNRVLEDLLQQQNRLVDEYRAKMRERLDEDVHSQSGDSDLHSEENMEVVQAQISALSDSVATVQGLLCKLREAPAPGLPAPSAAPSPHAQ